MPLVTVDPYFSIWSCSDALTDGHTKHWSEVPNPILAGVYIGNSYHSICDLHADFSYKRTKLYQTDLDVTPLSTTYKFENDEVKVKLEFTTPLLLDRPDILSRPVSYVAYEVENNSDKEVRFVFGISARSCVKEKHQMVEFKKTPYSLCCGNTLQHPLCCEGIVEQIDWGDLHLCDKDAYVAISDQQPALTRQPLNRAYNAFSETPYMVVEKKELKGVITLAYDEIKPIEYFGVALEELYKESFADFGDMVNAAIADMINETHDRVPLTDWYYTTNGKYRTFLNRTVVAGVFIKLI